MVFSFANPSSLKLRTTKATEDGQWLIAYCSFSADFKPGRAGGPKRADKEFCVIAAW